MHFGWFWDKYIKLKLHIFLHAMTRQCCGGRLHWVIHTFCLILSDVGVAGLWNNVSWDVNPESCDETLCKRIVPPMGSCYQEKQDNSCQKDRNKAINRRNFSTESTIQMV